MSSQISRQQTIDTYNRSAKQLADYFSNIGSRRLYIQLAFKLLGNPAKPRVLEIGCGDGRDAEEIVPLAGWYQGFDISEELIKLARARLPGVDFRVADAASFSYPPDLDMVFAFASLLHLNKQEVKKVLADVHQALKPGGIFYISLKSAPAYDERIKTDRFGTRAFYYYTPELIAELAGAGYETVLVCRETIGRTDWFEIGLKKKVK